MSGLLAHSPAAIVRQLLIDLAIGSEAASWPVYATSEPDEPDACLTVYDTAGRLQGRTHPDGEVQGLDGVMIRVRAADAESGWAKANAVAIALDEDVYDAAVALRTGVQFDPVVSQRTH